MTTSLRFDEAHFGSEADVMATLSAWAFRILMQVNILFRGISGAAIRHGIQAPVRKLLTPAGEFSLS